MANTQQASEDQSGGTPSGAVFHPLTRRAVSEEFIRSLREDGVSRETIKSIERENARATEAERESA